jgi:hypothetical protein
MKNPTSTIEDVETLVRRCTSNELRNAAIQCLASGMTVKEVLTLLDRLGINP